MSNWFDVDKEGLSNLVERRSKAFVIYELLQNAWDEDTDKVSVRIEPVENSPSAWVEVEDDDPEGFEDLRHAWTLFAESTKADDPEKRGRFNLGEKLVLALCHEAEIQTVSGTVFFSEEKGRTRGPSKRDRGSLFKGRVRMTRDELDEVIEKVDTVIVPDGVRTDFNGRELPDREPVAVIEETLPSEYADEDGVLRRTNRKTEVHIYEPREGENGTLYEMGIPVVETEDSYHVDVQQTIPLNAERTNVRPAYKRKVRRIVLNEMADEIDEEDAAEGWVNDALEDPDIEPEAVNKVVEKRYGDDAVSFDPSDPEANKRAQAEGRRVIHGSEFSSKSWDNIRDAGAVKPAGQVTPSPSPLDGGPDADPVESYDREEWTDGMEEVWEYSTRLCGAILSRIKGGPINVKVEFILPKDLSYAACFTHKGLTLRFNVRRLGKAWFREVDREELNDLLYHELAHHWVSDHLSDDYYEKLTEIGAAATELALERPELFDFR